ncbi:MAG: hypothetical protein ACREJC_19960, partial [Tepidisphaeraceae bacterium]
TVNVSGATWINSTSLSIGGSLFTAGGTATLTLSSGALIGGTLKIWNKGTVRYNGGSISLSALDVTGGQFLESANGNRLITANVFFTDSGGVIDLNDNDLQAKASTYAAITSQITSARNFGAWDGSGITSTAAKNDVNGITTLGTLTGQEYLDNSPSGPLFDGQTVGATHILVKYTYYGDSNFDGDVTLDDYAYIDGGFLLNFTGWLNGDYDYSGGKPDLDDYALIDGAFLLKNGVLIEALTWLEGGGVGLIGAGVALGKVEEHFGQFGPDYATALFAATPEPSISTLAVLAAGTVLTRRRAARSSIQ